MLLSLLNGVVLLFAAYKFFQIIQLSGYKIKGYFVWLKDTKAKYVSRIVTLSLLSLACGLVTNALFNVKNYTPGLYFSYLGLIFYTYFSVIFCINLYSAPKKVPLKNTTRMTRLNIALYIVVVAITFILIAVMSEFLPPLFHLTAIYLTPMFLPILVPCVHLLLVPLENLIVKKYVVQAAHRLKKYPELIKIGITGSYGKTSTKYMLNSILSQKYNVCMSPHSFNTITGLSKVINDYLKPQNQVLITEMGARNVGDIKKLAGFIKPKYGIITNIGSQHLLTFGSVENIENTKYELIQALPQDGYAVFNGDNAGAKKLYDKCPIKKDLVGNCQDSSVSYSRIRVDEKGTHFTLVVGEQKINCNTKLIGKHNVENILLCVRIALELGLTLEQIQQGIKNLKPVPHRLEMLNNDNNVIVLDDSYNASVEGSEVALDVLSKFGNKKIIVTPGLVELGNKEKEENYNFGVKMTKVADYIIIVNRVNREAILQGIQSTDFNMARVYQAETLNDAKQLLKGIVQSGDAVLFENDLPDNYI